MAATVEHSRWRHRRAALSAALATLLAIAGNPSIAADGVTGGVGKLEVDTRIANGWRVLRVVDCARCHGKDYAGLAAPSIVDYATLQSREMFVRTILDGDPGRGMPGYRGNAYVVENIDDIYRYFRARASGEVGPDYRPPPSAEQR